MDTIENKPPISHIIVVGFHHKLGCQVEFSYPSLIPGTSGKNECPSGWKYLPTLALPDGSHNFEQDTVFFNLPSLIDPTESVFGVSCYRQIPVEKLKIRTADVTRSTVQKSVCILSRLPIYGYIEVKLALIADAFFEQGDFECTELLVKAYQQLNACLLDDETQRPLRHFYVGLSLREIVLHWRHKALMLFKLFLLQKRVVCFGSPVRDMCSLILGIASLMPRLMEKGFQEVACVRTSRPLSPMPDYTDSLQRETAAARQQNEEDHLPALPVSPTNDSCVDATDDNSALVSSAVSAGSSSAESGKTTPDSKMHSQEPENDEDSIGDGNSVTNRRNHSLTRESSVDTLASSLAALCAVSPDDYRAPISIFTSGNLCLPYLSLPYMDLLSDPSVHSYIIGTSNVLFQQKRQLADVLVDIENANMETYDGDLRRQLVLSTEDLRFMDYLLKHVQAPKEDAEGSEFWIREQFQGYLLALLRNAVLAADSIIPAKELEHFNVHFMHAFRSTQCYQEWYDVRPDNEFFEMLPCGHPFATGQLSVADMKLKITQTMQNSESGRKINQAVNNTSRAVGGAISQAKGALTNWWSSITTQPINAVSQNSADNEQNSSTSGLNVSCQYSKSKTTANGSSSNNGDDIVAEEEGVAIVIMDGKQPTFEKTFDSAEELEEEDKEKTNNLESLGDQKIPTEESPRKSNPVAAAGIVEIGKEAETLDRSGEQQQQLPQQSQQQPNTGTCSNDINATEQQDAATYEQNNSNIFIV